MRVLVDQGLSRLTQILDGSALASDAYANIEARIALTDGLDGDTVRTVLAVVRDCLPAQVNNRELIQALDVLSKYGVGAQVQVESETRNVNYVVKVPTPTP
jgi:hypothetical protein